MTSRLFSQTVTRRLVIGTAVGTAAYATIKLQTPVLSDSPLKESAARVQFNKSYGYSPAGKELINPPKGWSGPVFKLRNDYPDATGLVVADDSGRAVLPVPGSGTGADPLGEMPWMKVDFKKNPELYCNVVKEYCYEGNVNNDFVVQKNQVRDWYHAPWMHWNAFGREPLHGLTYERPTPPGEFAKDQTSTLQTWACGFYNRAGATAFGKIWNNPDEPDWKPFKFPEGTAVFKILMTNASDKEVFTMKGAPGMQAVISKQPDPTKPPPNVGDRNDFPSTMRLLQMDFAVQDHRSEIGWVFGTFMYDGSQKNSNPWDRVIPVGIMWGNDPKLTPEKYAKGDRPVESWINPVADKLRVQLGGVRATKGWGFDGRLNGPADNFISACASCHSTAQWGKHSSMVPDKGKDPMRWFRNIPAGEPFDKGGISGDYSLQLMIGYANYTKWKDSNPNVLTRAMAAVPFTPTARKANMVEEKRKALRDV